MSKRMYLYILVSKLNGILFIGVTSDIVKRTREHKQGMVEGFTQSWIPA